MRDIECELFSKFIPMDIYSMIHSFYYHSNRLFMVTIGLNKTKKTVTWQIKHASLNSFNHEIQDLYCHNIHPIHTISVKYFEFDT